MEITGTIHVVDDERAIRDSLRLLLEALGFEVATYEDASGFLKVAAMLSGCVLTDVKMPGMNGLELQTWLREHDIRLPVIVMTGQADVPLAVKTMKLGAIDFLEKPFQDEQLLDAVRRGLRQSHEVRLTAAAAAQLERRIMSLTRREREVLDLLVVGMPTKAIANQLGASPRTIEVHRARVFDKLDANSLPELVRISFASNLKPVG
jgi:two-component system, LuxR family, response regulator FixJ